MSGIDLSEKLAFLSLFGLFWTDSNTELKLYLQKRLLDAKLDRYRVFKLFHATNALKNVRKTS